MHLNSGGDLNVEAIFGCDSFIRCILKGYRRRFFKYGGEFRR
jgi:hypothetical protein